MVTRGANEDDRYTARAQFGDHFQGLLHFAFGADDAHQVLHGFLQVVLDLVGVFTRRAAVKRLQRGFGNGVDLRQVNGRGAIVSGEFSSEFSGALAKNQ